MRIISDKEFETIYNKFYKQILIYCNARLHFNRSYAEDCTEKVFETFYLKRDQFYSIENIRAWLYRTADNLIKKSNQEWKKDRETFHYDQSDDMEVGSDLSEVPDFENKISEEQIEKYKDIVLSQLSPAKRELYQSRFIQKMSYKDLAVRYKISENTLRQRIFALKKEVLKLIFDCLK